MTFDEAFVEENKLSKINQHVSDNNKYLLEISTYKVGKPEDHYWSYTRGQVYNILTNELLFDIKRNYSSFWYLFVEHPNGNDYLLCGRDYHGGYNIFDLTNKKEYEYKPDHSGHYMQCFCWVDAFYNEYDKTLSVEGCYWACPFEKVIFDFSDPTKVPLTELSRQDLDNND